MGRGGGGLIYGCLHVNQIVIVPRTCIFVIVSYLLLDCGNKHTTRAGESTDIKSSPD